ncbi:MAG: polysaccharide biosynthesis/export family protein [Paracoccaceae bacterium]
MTRLFRSIAVIALLSGLAACNLPQGAGREGQILKGADEPDASFAVHYVTRETLPKLTKWPVISTSGTAGWITRSGGSSGQIIEAGDKLDLTIWDNEESSLLSSAGQKVIVLAGLTVSPKGSIFLPYADEVYVAKMSPDAAREAIQAKLLGIVPSAQVQLNMQSGLKNSVDIVSGVAKPGSYPLPDRNYSILSLLALAGGVPETTVNPQVRLMRDGKVYGVPMDKLLKNAEYDAVVRGGDKIYVEGEDRYFLSLGASGVEAQIDFPQDYVTALDAMSLAGGLNDTRANPKGILILRDYRESQVRADGTGPERERIVFAFDLTNADGLFSAGEFPIQHRDLVLVTESPVNTANTIFGLIGRVIGLNNQVESL